MSSPYVSGSAAIAARFLRGTCTVLWIGDSIGVSLEGGVSKYWRNPVAGVGYSGYMLNALGSTSKVTIATGGMDPEIGAGAGLAYSQTLYTPWNSAECKFTGEAYGPIANGFSNRILVGSPGILDTAANRAAACFDGLDWLAQSANTTVGFLTYGDATAQAGLVREYLVDVTSAAISINAGVPVTSGGYAYTTASVASSTLVAHGQSITVRVDEGTPTADKSFTLLHAVVKTDRPGMTLIPMSVGGWRVTSLIPGYDSGSLIQKVSADALAACALLSPDIIVIALAYNASSDGIGGTANATLYQTQLGVFVAQLRTHMPNASIIFLSTYDANAASQDGYNDANYNVHLVTPNSAYLNLYRAAGKYTDLNAEYLSDGLHPNGEGVGFFLARIQDLAQELAGSGGAQFVGNSGIFQRA